ncbi:phosphatidylinositol N-acetylglucosaminyltransferase subunit Y-domain-containing protein [Entophlyctis helioformis]|nr:phosphatidylinositol N-acetylglucosaminyltransferase subunit Y-domain-containing protein [Entophlyctis helioformis]
MSAVRRNSSAARRNSLFQPGAALVGAPLTPYSVFRGGVDPRSSRSRSPTLAPPSPRTNQSAAAQLGELRIYGWFLLAFTIAYLGFNAFTIVGSKLLIPEQSGSEILDWIRNDRYYCYLVPILGPVFVFFVFFNWLGMKYFRQNA